MKKKTLALVLALTVIISMFTVIAEANEKSYNPVAELVYNDHTYYLYDESITFAEAKEYCESHGRYLATITSEAEQEAVMNLVKTGEKNWYWIGGYRNSNGDFAWVTGEKFDYANWEAGEPSNSSCIENSIQLYRIADPGKGSDTVGSWNDIVDVGSTGFYSVSVSGFICEEGDVPVSSDSEKEESDNTPSDVIFYNGHTYQKLEKGITWTEAKKLCESQGGYLATITSEDEQEAVMSLISGGSKNCYWLGGYRMDDGNFAWVSGEPFDYTSWDAAEPSNSGGVEDYLQIYRIPDPGKWNSVAGGWNDVANEGEINFHLVSNFGYVCEWDYIRSSFGSEISQWASDELEQAYDLDLIPESLVGQDLTQNITRAEFAAVSVKTYEKLANGAAIPAINNPFTDTNDIEVLKAYNVGITTGVSKTEFDPHALLNREQAATMLTRVFKKVSIAGWTIDTDGQFKLTYDMPAVFADDNEISDWARDSVYFMAANGIINGVGNNEFAPQNTTTEEEATGYANATREQALIIATRMIENLK